MDAIYAGTPAHAFSTHTDTSRCRIEMVVACTWNTNPLINCGDCLFGHHKSHFLGLVDQILFLIGMDSAVMKHRTHKHSKAQRHVNG